MDWKKYQFPVLEAIPKDANYCDTVDFLPGRGSLVPVKVFKKIGNINAKRFPHYISDYDFFARVKKAGFKLAVSYDAKILSDTSATGIVSTDDPHMSVKQFLAQHFSVRSMGRFIDHYRFISDHAPEEYKHKLQNQLIRTVTKRALYLIPGFYYAHQKSNKIRYRIRAIARRVLYLIPGFYCAYQKYKKMRYPERNSN